MTTNPVRVVLFLPLDVSVGPMVPIQMCPYARSLVVVGRLGAKAALCHAISCATPMTCANNAIRTGIPLSV
jgi:hypothetical protein